MEDTDDDIALITNPVVIKELPEISIPAATPLEPADGEEQAKKADLPIANTMLEVVHVCWGEVKSIAGVQRLLKMTIEATKHRRDVLGIPYGSRADSNTKSGMVYPLD